jgi:hypothetical protein
LGWNHQFHRWRASSFWWHGSRWLLSGYLLEMWIVRFDHQNLENK